MDKKIVKKVTGYSAFDKATGKALRCRHTNWTIKTMLTDDPEHFVIADTKAGIIRECEWFNTSHKNKVEFEIKKVSRIYTTEIIVEEEDKDDV